MLTRYQALKNKYIGLKHQLDNSKSQLKRVAVQLTFLKVNRKEWVMARDFFTGVAELTQADIINYLEDTVSLAMNVIPSDEPLSLVADYKTRRDQQELDLFTQEGDKEPIPLLSKYDQIGNSVEEMIAYASRLCMWSVMEPQPAPFQFHDEPFRALEDENLRVAAKVVRELHERLGIQTIIITQNPVLEALADRTFRITKRKGTAHVRQIGGSNASHRESEGNKLQHRAKVSKKRL